MNIKDLTKPLSREHIDFRVAQVILAKNKDTVWASILAYKDARVDMEILDEVVGPMNWQNEYHRDSKGVLQCGIGIYHDPTKQWIWKWSNGIPSNFESEKGEYSDAFKRAGFMWGIGRKLYDFPTIFVQLIQGDWYEKDGKAFATSKLRPNDWKWEISEDYQSVTASRKVNGKLVQVFNSKPY
jgi:hypothetical protein